MKARCLATVCAALFSTAPTFAVTLAPDGLGQVLLYPYYTVEGGTNTLVSVENTTPRGKAVRIRLLEALHGRTVLDLNLYMSPFDVWTAMITEDAGGGAKLVVNDATCTVPAIATAIAGSGETAIGTYGFDGSGGLPADAEASRGVARTREGSIEIIEMGDIDPEYELPGGVNFLAAILHTGDVPSNCLAVAQEWLRDANPFPDNGYGSSRATADVHGLYATSGGLAGAGTLINVAQGTDYSYDPVVLTSFYMNKPPIHTNIVASAPSLADAHPTSTVTVVDTNGIPTRKSDDWTNPAAGAMAGIDAVSAVLTRSALINEVVFNTSIHASTDWVIAFPTKRWYVDQVERPVRPFSSRLAVPYGDCEEITLTAKSQSGESAGWGYSPANPTHYGLCWQVNVITFGTPVLDSQLPMDKRDAFDLRFGARVRLPDAWTGGHMIIGFPPSENKTAYNWANANVYQSMSPELPSHQLANEAAPNHTFEGLPVIGFAVQRYVNDVLPGGVLSNYGGAYAHRYERKVTP